MKVMNVSGMAQGTDKKSSNGNRPIASPKGLLKKSVIIMTFTTHVVRKALTNSMGCHRRNDFQVRFLFMVVCQPLMLDGEVWIPSKFLFFRIVLKHAHSR